MIPLVVAYYAAASAAAMGGAAAAKLLHSKAQHLEVVERARHEAEARKQYLKTQMSLEEMRREAAEAGLDPRLIDEGYEAIVAQKVSPEDVRAFLESMSRSS